MEIFLTTRGRADKQLTLDQVNLKDVKIILAVDSDEREQYSKYKKKGVEIMLVPAGSNLSQKRQFIVENATQRDICLIDDDLRFRVRKQKGELSMRKAEKEDVSKMFALLEKWLKNGNPVVGISPAEMNRWVEKEIDFNTRMLCVMGFNREVLIKNKIRFDAIDLMSDYHVILSLLESGYSNRVSFKYAYQHNICNAPGGCSFYRTPELMKTCAYKLRGMHPESVEVVKKKTAKPWNGFEVNVRFDAKIFWKKAFTIGQAKLNRVNSPFKSLM